MSLRAVLAEVEAHTPFLPTAGYTQEPDCGPPAAELEAQELYPTYVPDIETDEKTAGPTRSGFRSRFLRWGDHRGKEGEPEPRPRPPLSRRPSHLSITCRFGSDTAISDKEEHFIAKYKRKYMAKRRSTDFDMPFVKTVADISSGFLPTPRYFPVFNHERHMILPKPRTVDERNAMAANLYIFETNVFAVTLLPQHGLHEDYRQDGGDKIELLARELRAAFVRKGLLTHVESSCAWEATILVKWHTAADIERVTECLNRFPLPSLRVRFRSSEVETLEHQGLMALFNTLDLLSTLRLQVACTYDDPVTDDVWEELLDYLTDSRSRTVRHLVLPPFHKLYEELPELRSYVMKALWEGNVTLESLCFHGQAWCGDVEVTSDWWPRQRCSGCLGDQGEEDSRKAWAGIVDVGIRNRMIRMTGVEKHVLHARWLGQVLLRKVRLRTPPPWAPASIGRRIRALNWRSEGSSVGGPSARPARRATFLDLPYEVRSRIVEMAADPHGHVATPVLWRAIDAAVASPRIPPRVRLHQWQPSGGWSVPRQVFWPECELRFVLDNHAMGDWLDSQGLRWYGTVEEGIEWFKTLRRPTRWQRLVARVLNTFSLSQLRIIFDGCGQHQVAALTALLGTLDLPATHKLQIRLSASPWPRAGSFPEVYPALRDFLAGPRSRKLRSLILPPINRWWAHEEWGPLFLDLQETNTSLEHVCFENKWECGTQDFASGTRTFCLYCHVTRMPWRDQQRWPHLSSVLTKNFGLRGMLERVAVRTNVLGQVLLRSEPPTSSPPAPGEAGSAPPTPSRASFANLPPEIRRTIVALAGGAVGVLDTHAINRVLDHAAERRPIPGLENAGLPPWEAEVQLAEVLGEWLSAGGFTWAGTPEGALEWMMQQEAEGEPAAFHQASRT
ncbi:uncharacterized protein LOC62_07G009600 [Vanrija pseudolonga]|uniref:Uncharacterized protein n=1 Tax=Vanrija pseudolonga TaxID=143232 RepID=A0AAF1BLN0_9TREE|nr:hypothetical protein LOC62_07G009600 [Vanrija pseudolonga]